VEVVSYRATDGLEEPPHFLEVEWLPFRFSPQPERAYRRFVAQGKGVKI